jgi:hypothetical protein
MEGRRLLRPSFFDGPDAGNCGAGRQRVTAVNEQLVRHWFEWHGYLVSQPRQYVVPGRQKTADEEIDLIICNPCVKDHRVPERMEWTSADLKTVARAVVGVRGWHTERFYASTFEQAPDILRFVEQDSLRHAAAWLGTGSMARILCLPRLPASAEVKQKTVRVLRERGIHGVVTFRTILAELILSVDVNRNYEKSDVLQIIRLLKNYDFLKDNQLELFARGRRRRKKP